VVAGSLNDPFHRRLQTARCIPACSDCYRLERPLPRGTCTLSRIVPLHGTRLHHHYSRIKFSVHTTSISNVLLQNHNSSAPPPRAGPAVGSVVVRFLAINVCVVRIRPGDGGRICEPRCNDLDRIDNAGLDKIDGCAVARIEPVARSCHWRISSLRPRRSGQHWRQCKIAAALAHV